MTMIKSLSLFLGNHELYNFNRQELSYLYDKYLFEHSHSEHSFDLKNTNCKNDDSRSLYYKFSPFKGIKMLSLDTYDISVLGYNECHPKYKLASDLLKTHHGHSDFELWDSDATLFGDHKRFQSSNGALSEEQLNWLDKELEESDHQNEVVIVFGHVGLHPGSCGWDSILWNYDQVLECFNRHSCVVAYFNGHAHNSGYAFENGIHYVVFHGIIETDPKEDAFATVSVYEDKIFIDGKGVEQQLILSFTRKISTNENNRFEELVVENKDAVDEIHLMEIELEV